MSILDNGLAFFRNLVGAEPHETTHRSNTPPPAVQDNLADANPFQGLQTQFPLDSNVPNLLTDNQMQNMYSTHFDRIDISTNTPNINETAGEAERAAPFWQSVFLRGRYLSNSQVAPVNQIRQPLGGKTSQQDLSTSGSDTGGANMTESEVNYQKDLSMHYDSMVDGVGGGELDDAELDFGATIGGKVLNDDEYVPTGKSQRFVQRGAGSNIYSQTKLLMLIGGMMIRFPKEDTTVPWAMSYCLH